MKKLKLSEYVKKLREESNLTINEFAKLHNLSHTQISKYESGQLDDPTALVISKLCRKLGIEGSEFLENVETPTLSKNIVDYSDGAANLEYLINPKHERVAYEEIVNWINDPHSPCGSIELYGEYNELPDKDYLELYFDATASTKYFEDVYITYFPYKKVQTGKTPFKFYHDINDAIASLYLQENNKYQNVILMTPSYEAYKYFTERKYRQVEDLNIILLYYKYRRPSEYTVICGEDFLKD